MNHPEFTELRRKLDEAITYQELTAAKRFAREGLRLARERECLGEVMYFRAQQKVIAGKHEEATGYLMKALEFNPLDGAAYNDLALCRVEIGKIDGVLELFDKGISVEPDYATIHHNKGWFLNQLGHYHEALSCFERALSNDPCRAVTYENMADAYENLGQVDNAIKAYQKVLDLLEPAADSIKAQIKKEIKRLEKGR
jgi:tetratricopeptide (TPR) repeat protein